MVATPLSDSSVAASEGEGGEEGAGGGQRSKGECTNKYKNTFSKNVERCIGMVVPKTTGTTRCMDGSM